MTAYLVLDIEITDVPKFEEYKRLVPPLVAKHGGVYLVRGGEHEVLEGDWHPRRVVLFRFPDRGAIHRFMDDPEYQPLKKMRLDSARTRMVAVDGVAD
jgi:uncharacterized protein (DUF1330 family)